MRKVTGVDCTWDVTSDEPGPARVPRGTPTRPRGGAAAGIGPPPSRQHPTRAAPDGARRLSLPRLVLRLPGKPSSNSPYFGGNLSPGLGHAPHLPSLPKASPRPPQATTALALGLSSPQGPAEASLRSHRAASVSPLASVRLTCRLYRVGDMVPTELPESNPSKGIGCLCCGGRGGATLPGAPHSGCQRCLGAA